MLSIGLSGFFRTSLVLSMCMVLFACGGGSSNNNNTVSETEAEIADTAPAGFNLVWSEEFNGDSLDASKWNIETGYGPNNAGWGNDESQLYTTSSDNLKVENGNLVITARCDSGSCGKRDGSITSAKINTKDKFEVKYGNIQARIKTPNGKSTWPAFWMLGANFPDTNWPFVGEIDVMEMHQVISNTRETNFAVHWFDDTRPAMTGTRGHQFFVQSKEFNEPLTNDFHVFETQWDENQIIGKIDGITYFKRVIDPATMDEFQKEFYMILNVAIDGTLGGEPDQIKTAPQDMLVDWVRVYKSDGTDTNIDPVSTFDDGLLEDGDFEGGAGVWAGNGSNVTFDSGNLINSANVAVAGNPHDVNLAQKVSITQSATYTFSFKAKTEGNRTIVAGIGLNEAPWTNSTELVNLTSEWQTFEYTLTASDFGSDNSRVFFDMGADTGLVLIDDVSLMEVVSNINTNTVAGEELAVNGDFEIGSLSGWVDFPGDGVIEVSSLQNNGGSSSGRLVAAPAQDVLIKQANLAAGSLSAGDTFNVSFDLYGSVSGDGGVVFAEFFSELTGGGVSKAEILSGGPLFPTGTWTNYSYMVIAGTDVSGGVTLQLKAACGAVAGCGVDAYFDNISIIKQ